MIGLAFVALLCSSLFAQSREGIFRYADGSSRWKINDHHTLIWDDKPYLPVGLRVGATDEELTAAKAGGISDVLIEMRAGANWAQTVAKAESEGMRYLVCINSLAPMAYGYAVDPAGYRLSGITAPKSVELSIPGATSALLVFITDRDNSVEKMSRHPVIDGKLKVDLKPLNDLDHTLLIYPEMRSLTQTDFWESFDEHRDLVLRSVKTASFGKGYRGLINPVGAALSIGSRDPSFVPTSPFFRAELRSYLENKYRSVRTLERSWYVGSTDLESIEEYARLVPLWSGKRGLGFLWDSDTDRLYQVDSSRSTCWADIQTVINGAAARRFQRLVRAIRLLADAPIIQDWSGWVAPYEVSSPMVDGLGMRVSGTTPSAIAEDGARVTSSVKRWPRPGLLMATDVDIVGPDSVQVLSNVLDDLASLGARGWFLRASPALIPSLKAEADKRSIDASYAEWSPVPLFYPVNASHPARPQRLVGGIWWLPSPADGNRLEFGKGFFGYRYQALDESFTAIWSASPAARVKLRMTQPKSATFVNVDGTDPKPKFLRDGVEVTLGQMPLIIKGTIEIPVPQAAIDETLARFGFLLQHATSIRRDVTEESFFLKEMVAGLDRNPGGAYVAIRDAFEKLSKKVGAYTWLEAELSRNHNFSGPTGEVTCSAGSSLSLRALVTGGGISKYTAEYRVPVKATAEQEVWIAARIPQSLRSGVRVNVAGQTLKLSGEPISNYGSGYGWYKLGSVSLTGDDVVATLEIEAPTGAELAVDVILLTPLRFSPMGIVHPDAIAFPATTPGRQD